MKSNNSLKFANIIWNHWNKGTLISDINSISSIAPKSRLEGYEIQRYFYNLSPMG